MRQSRRTELRASTFGQELFLVSSKFGVSKIGAGVHGGVQKIKSFLERGPFCSGDIEWWQEHTYQLDHHAWEAS